MANAAETRAQHGRAGGPSPWVARFAGLVAKRARILDLACGGGRHGRLFLSRGHPVTMLDKDVSHVLDLAQATHADIIEADLEAGAPVFDGNGPLAGRTFGAIVVVNYLYRPVMPHLVPALEAGGVLIYETFARGNEAFGRPRNPDFLLKSGELLDLVRGRMRIVAYAHGLIQEDGCPRVKQRIAAVKDVA